MPTAGTRPEKALLGALRRLGIPEPECQPSDIPGDLVWRFAEVSVFADGCSWHRCPIHFRAHTTGADPRHGLTREGAALQAAKDRRIREALRARGFKVLAFWEHDIARAAAKCARQIQEALTR
jgi:DNA mismatch endonuclease (patch repair protein)